MVANFQYLITCIAFSTAKPFRKPIWTNYPFLFCIVFLFIFDTVCVFIPSDSNVAELFDLLPFRAEDGTRYYSYRYGIAFGIFMNSVLTYVAEKYIVNVVTKKSDLKVKNKKQANFETKMDEYRVQGRQIQYKMTGRDED